jgi:hypothetical protein
MKRMGPLSVNNTSNTIPDHVEHHKRAILRNKDEFIELHQEHAVTTHIVRESLIPELIGKLIYSEI